MINPVHKTARYVLKIALHMQKGWLSLKQAPGQKYDSQKDEFFSFASSDT
jgi:hypothetical protein